MSLQVYTDVIALKDFVYLTRKNVDEVAEKTGKSREWLISELDYYEELGNHHVRIPLR